VTSPIRHHAGKEDRIEEEACQLGAARSIAASASIRINSIIATTTSIRGEPCKTHHSCHIITRLAVGSRLETCFLGRVEGRI
jgi:hypothetical protein